MSFLELKNVNLGFGPLGNRTEVLHDINLRVEENEFVAVIGFSGSGKSTLISVIAGLLEPDSGEVLLGGQPMQGPGPDRGIVFQNYSLLPWLSVHGNIDLAVRQVYPGWTKAQRDVHIRNYINLVSLNGSEGKRPRELSGGMRQRLSLARTLSTQPKILLLDEPLSALDALTRSTLQDEITRLWEEDRRTIVMITNDVDEAILMADRIIALTPGPKATLGEQFAVKLTRPRDRTTFNFDPEFKKLRNQVTGYMMELNEEATALRPRPDLVLPNIQPISVSA